MSNVLSEEKKQQVIALGRLGWSLRRIEHATGVRRETAGTYLKAAGIAVLAPGGWGRGALAKPANEVTTGSGEVKPANEVTTDCGGSPSGNRELPSASQDQSASACEPYRDAIELGLSRGRNAMAIWQDLVSDYGFASGYQTVKRFVRKLRGSQLPHAVGIILTVAGEEAQVDYGTGPMVRDPQSGKYRRTRLFVMTLGYSRKSVRLLVFHSSSRIWAELHEKAFRSLGGSVRVVVLDNLREGVIAPDIYDPTLNPLYRDVLAHYGTVAMISLCLLGKRIGSNLEMRDGGRIAFSSFEMPDRSVLIAGPHAASLPSSIRIVDAEINIPRIEVHGVGNSQSDKLLLVREICDQRIVAI
jgi:transposase